MKTAVKIFALTLFILGTFSEAKASLINYSYAGNYFNSFSSPSSYTTSNRVTGSFTVDELMLPSNSHFSLPLADYKSAVTLIAFSDGLRTLTAPISYVFFSTNSAGDINSWKILLQNSTYDYITTSYIYYSGSDVGRLGQDNWGQIPNSPGLWNKTIIPIPGAVWLLGSGLIGIVGVRRKFKK